MALQPLSPAIPAMANSKTEASRLPPRRSLPARGNSSSASEIGASLPQKPPPRPRAAEATGNWMFNATVAAPEPAGTLAGEKLAVAPAGRPLAENAIAFANVPAPFAGLTVTVSPTVPPGCTAAELFVPLATPMVKSVVADGLMLSV